MSTHYRGSPDEIRSLDTFIKLMRAAESTLSATRRTYAEAGLTDSQFGVLEALLHLGPLTPGHLGRKILKSAGNITLVIDNLVKGGLIERLESAEDRRRRPVALTPAGRSLIERLFPIHARRVVQVMRSLSANEQERLSLLLRTLGTTPS